MIIFSIIKFIPNYGTNIVKKTTQKNAHTTNKINILTFS